MKLPFCPALGQSKTLQGTFNTLPKMETEVTNPTFPTGVIVGTCVAVNGSPFESVIKISCPEADRITHSAAKIYFEISRFFFKCQCQLKKMAFWDDTATVFTLALLTFFFFLLAKLTYSSLSPCGTPQTPGGCVIMLMRLFCD